MEKRLQDIDVILWDFDGVLYSYHQNDIPAETLKENYWSANAKGASELIPSLEYDKAYEIGGAGFLKYHDTVSGFLPYREETGLDEFAFKQTLLSMQLKWSYKNISQNIPQLIESCEETNILFSELQPHIRHVMITHSSAKDWAHPVSKDLKVESYFDYILGYDDFDFQCKGENAHAVKVGLEKLNAHSAQSAFIEDQVKHLEKAKEAYPDLMTVFIEGREPIEQPDYVDIVVKRPKDFMRQLLQAKRQKEKAA